jgi:hypothetical protein
MSNLNDPIKSPIVNLYNYSGTLLVSYIEGLGLGIVEFTYEYDDEEPDKCTIKIQAVDSEDIDKLNISRNDILKIQWGYITGPLSPLVTVAVRDISSKYGTNIIYTTFICNDLTNYLRLVKSKDIRKMSLVNYISDYATRRVNVVIQSGTDTIYKQVLHDPTKHDNRLLEINNSINPIIYNPILKRGKGFDLTLPNVEPDPNTDTGKWYVDANNPVRQYFEKELDMISINRSPYNLITEYLNSCPQGPWFVTGRANTLFIHNRNMGNSIFKNYTYHGEPGDLMDFEPETKYENYEKQIIASTNLDPYTKEFSGLDTYINRLSTTKSLKQITSDFKEKKISETELDSQLKEFILAYHESYKPYMIQTQTFDYYTEADNWINNNINDFLPQSQDALLDARKAMIKSILVPEGQRNVSPLQRYLGQVLVYSIPADSPEDIMVDQTNTVRKLEMETEEARAIIEGDPYMMSEFVVGIHNVQKAHKGNYYIKKCEHSITESGYKTTMEMFKVKNSAIIKNISTLSGIEDDREKAISLKLPEYKLKQEEIFEKWNIIIKWELKHESLALASTPGWTEHKVMTSSEILERTDLNEDEQRALIEQYIKDPKYEAYCESRLKYSPENR